MSANRLLATVLLAAGLLAAGAAWVALAQPRFASAAAWLFALLLLLAPTVHYWYLTWFLVLLLPGRRLRWRIVRGAARTALRLSGTPLHVEGLENLPKDGAFLAVNHASYFDSLVLAAAVPGEPRFVAKRELFRVPVLGWALAASGCISIDRRNRGQAIRSLRQAGERIRAGRSVVLFPEGSRSRDGRLAPFKKGAFHLAMQAGVPMVPIVIHNSGDVQPKGDFLYHPGTVEVEVLPPVDTTRWEAATIDDHVAEVRGMFLKALGQESEPPKLQEARQRTV